MKHAISATIIVLAVFVSAAAAQTDEKDSVRVPLMNYIKGHETGQGEYFRKAFHTEGSMVWVRDGKFTSRTFAEYIAGASGKPAADEKDRRRSIEGIEIAGTAATAKIILDYPNVRFVDFMSLLKIDGKWKIVSKVFYAEPKNTR